MHPQAPVAVMDSTCALCSFGARMIHRLDRSQSIRICPIQTEMGRQLLAANGLDPIDPDSWLFIENGTVWRDFDALIRVGERSGGWGRALSLLRLIPARPRGWLYARIARNRYALFGRGDMCAIPDPALRARLIG
ncbi:thiol-disulfide oxidoreductase DCC family protein [Yoonia sp. R2331]|uniref:thiol-disulfide oxidoreductase DCC family protein n=1 Tax=Yoonia sp. R2331 TaxID=3237238 RepID=UPI0034E54BF9